MNFLHSFLHYVTYPYLLRGAVVALEVTLISFVLGLALALILAMMRESRLLLLRAVSGFYVWILRGTPILLQLIFLYDVLPSAGVRISAVPTAILGFALNEGAFQCEILRGGIHSVPKPQTLAADAMGMSKYVSMRYVVLPQALKAVIPTYGNEVINLWKNTSLASVIAVSELTQRSEEIASTNFQYIRVFAAAGALYLILTTLLAWIQRWLESKYEAKTQELPGLLTGRFSRKPRRDSGSDVPKAGLVGRLSGGK